MALTGNKGEWSEIYAFLKLLGEGRVFAGDEEMNRIEGLFYPIIKIIRSEREGRKDYVRDGQRVSVQEPGGRELLSLDAQRFLEQAESLLSAIRAGHKAFPVPETEAFMGEIHCHDLKAPSADKTDIRIVLHDRRTSINSEMGFSIKSRLGSDSTLLNASSATNVSFMIVGVELTEDEISRINAIDTASKIKDRIGEIKKAGGKLVYDKIDNPTFRNNLLMLDGDLPKVVASLLLAYVDSGKKRIPALLDIVVRENPLGYDLASGSPIYAYKIKHLLTSVALGMMPGKAWNGIFDANGGYLVVKADGDIVCYHFYDRNRFENYLLANAYLERASTTRHGYALITRQEDGILRFTLNLQIRLG